MFEFNPGWVRELKGAPLSMLILLHLAKEAVSKGWLAVQSGYSDKTVALALAFLLGTGRITKTADELWFRAGEFQMTLGPEPEFEDDSVFDASRRISDSDGIINIIKLSNRTTGESNNNNTSRRNSDSDENTPIWEALRKAGVYRNERTEKMLELPHVNLEYVRALIKQLEADGHGGREWGGLFIRLCEQAEPVRPEERWVSRHYEGCDCNGCIVERGIWELERRKQR
jgi:hypothetical protein